MWLRKAAIAAVVSFCASSALADGWRISIGGGWGRHGTIISRPGHAASPRHRHDHHDRDDRRRESVRVLRGDLVIDGQAVCAVVTLRTDAHGYASASVRLEAHHGRRLPSIDAVCLEIDHGRHEHDAPLRRVDRDRDEALYAGSLGRVGDGEATITLRVTTCEGTSRAQWCGVSLGGC